MTEPQPYTPLTMGQEVVMRDATTTGDLDTVHSAGVLAWCSLWSLIDALRAKLADSQKEAGDNEARIVELTRTVEEMKEVVRDLRAALGFMVLVLIVFAVVVALTGCAR